MKEESQKVRLSWSQNYVVSAQYVLNADRNTVIYLSDFSLKDISSYCNHQLIWSHNYWGELGECYFSSFMENEYRNARSERLITTGMQGIQMLNTHWFQDSPATISFECLCGLPSIKLISEDAVK